MNPVHKHLGPGPSRTQTAVTDTIADSHDDMLLPPTAASAGGGAEEEEEGEGYLLVEEDTTDSSLIITMGNKDTYAHQPFCI